MERKFTEAANVMARAAGKPLSFAGCCALILIWSISGPAMGFSDTWQLIINTATTIVTFLMVFLIQNSQNRDSAPIQLCEEASRTEENLAVDVPENLCLEVERKPGAAVGRRSATLNGGDATNASKS